MRARRIPWAAFIPLLLGQLSEGASWHHPFSNGSERQLFRFPLPSVVHRFPGKVSVRCVVLHWACREYI